MQKIKQPKSLFSRKKRSLHIFKRDRRKCYRIRRQIMLTRNKLQKINIHVTTSQYKTSGENKAHLLSQNVEPCRAYTPFFLNKNVVFPAQAEYSYFFADFRLKIFLYYS